MDDPGSSHTRRRTSSRRQFLGNSLVLAAASVPVLRTFVEAQQGERKLRAAIIGHTGHGNYGHDHELIFNGRENIEMVAVADPDAAGRAKAAARSGAARQYQDYREMLEKERPDLVCVAPRWTDEHHAMALAVLKAGAHLYIEKPITQTLAEADQLLRVARGAGLKVVVPHQMRLAPNILALKGALGQGLIGELLEIRAHGKQDHRAGGEDLIVLGVHLFDLMRFYAGDASWCTARVLDKGHEVTAQDAHPATEGIGLVIGEEIFAQFAFAGGVNGTFTSQARNWDSAGPWGLELVGSRGSVRIMMEMIPRIYTLKIGRRTAEGCATEWRVWGGDPTLKLAEVERTTARAHTRAVDDWLHAIAMNREPVCSGFAAMNALEMAHAVFAAGLSRGRVDFPLKNRQHPLARG